MNQAGVPLAAFTKKHTPLSKPLCSHYEHLCPQLWAFLLTPVGIREHHWAVSNGRGCRNLRWGLP